jgi:lantibiotic biosynthesis protein
MALDFFPFIIYRTPLQSIIKAYTGPLRNDPVFEEGLYLASAEFFRESEKKAGKSIKDQEKIEKSLSKYWLRSCTRCTPYGIFAGSAIANVTDSDTSIILEKNTAHRRIIRIDMGCLNEITEALNKDTKLQAQLKYTTNNSLYKIQNGFRFAEYTIIDGVKAYNLIAIENSAYLSPVIELANTGAGIHQFAELLVKDHDVTDDEAAEFITELCSSQLLISEIEPNITGNNPLEELLRKLEHFSGVDNIKHKLAGIKTLLENKTGGIPLYQQLEAQITNLPLDTPVMKNILQVDMYLSTQKSEISKKIIQSISTQLEALLVLSKKNNNPGLSGFKNRFTQKYEDAEVPLSVALDSETGIGYADVNEDASSADFINDLAIAIADTEQYNFDFMQKLAATKYNDYLYDAKEVIEITSADLEAIKKENSGVQLPSSLYAMGSIIKCDDAPGGENFLFSLTTIDGPSAANLLGRFAGGDEKFREAVTSILQKEEEGYEDIIFAEIVHLPQSRIGNILLRPVLRQYEIPYAGKSGAAAENQLHINDLLVSIRNNRIVLRSKKLNKQVIPRLTTAHNFTQKSLPVYKFLCDLQRQDYYIPHIWDWGQLRYNKRLPRVVFKNIIITAAQWRIELGDVGETTEGGEEMLSRFADLRKKLKMPRYTVHAENDNELLLDLTDPGSLSTLYSYLKKYGKTTLKEFLFTPENCIVKDVAENPYTNEVIIPFHYSEAFKIPGVPSAPKNVVLQRKFFPGSEWLYYKVYCGPKTIEKVLTEYVLPFIENAIVESKFEKFFFLRYKDDFTHLRIRFFNTSPEKQQLLHREFTSLLNGLAAIEMTDKFMLDTYTREIGRYYENTMELSETIFFNDSLAVLRLANLLGSEDGDKYRLIFAMRGIDSLLSDFNCSIAEKGTLLKDMQKGFFREFWGGPVLQKQLNDKYRLLQKEIFSFMNSNNDDSNGITEMAEFFKIRSEMNEGIATRIMQESGADVDRSRLHELLRHYIHMFINRLFLSSQRKHELLIYFFTDKYYQSLSVIQKVSPDK